MTRRTASWIAAGLSFVVQCSVFLCLYPLMLERRIGAPGSHSSLAFILDSNLALWTTGSAISVALLAALLTAWSAPQVWWVRLRSGFLDALWVTLLVAFVALPTAGYLAVAMWDH